jgi:hypothetical protein
MMKQPLEAFSSTRSPLSRVALSLAALGALLTAVVNPALAGEVYGKVAEGPASVGDAATVAAKCGAKAYPAAKTDKAGAYHLALAESGKCTLTVSYKGQSASIEVASYDDPVQVDIVLESKDGKLAARRR